LVFAPIEVLYCVLDVSKFIELFVDRIPAEGMLKTFNYVVANPPFSDQRGVNGVSIANYPHDRCTPYGTLPDKQGDYSYFVAHCPIVEECGKGDCILPHGVLFRGNTEAEIRKNLIKRVVNH
jgi:type I restriction enzyme M protein